MTQRIVTLPGDGIGKEVIPAAERVLSVVRDRFGLDLDWDRWDLGADRYLRDGVTLTDTDFETLRDDSDAILIGAFGDPRVPDSRHARDILLGLRFRLDLYVNFRPCVLLDPTLSPLRLDGDTEIRIEIFRENTEGVYLDIGGRLRPGTTEEVAIQEDLNTYRGVARIVRASFEYARAKGRDRVTLVDKANAMPTAGALWRRVFAEIAEEFEEIGTDAMYVDAMAMDLVRRPDRYGVVVTSNLFGDILSDLAAELTGGLGLAPSANLHPGRTGLFEPVHGSAPDIAGMGRANPIATIRCLSLMLDHLGHPDAAVAVESAATRVVRSDVRTADLGGSATTDEVTDAVCAALEAST